MTQPTMGTKRPEILAPAGNADMLRAAVYAGADAVYLGLLQFNARRSAENFSAAALRDAVAFCHARDVKVYVAVNTLAYPDELPALCEAVRCAARAGADALIVQDLAAAALAKRAAPGLALHASTQMSVHSLAGVKMLEQMGFARVILARELSLAEIRAIAQNTALEVECFVHGALCMSVSGQCYMSAFFGGRSGNRGACAGPCRLPFAADGQGGPAASHLSLKDHSHIGALGDLAAAGVASFKIEGRLKGPEYVAAAVDSCLAARDGRGYDEEILQNVFSRSGFTDGYLTGRYGAPMFGVRTEADAAAAKAALPRLRELYRRERQSVPVDMVLDIGPKAARLTVTDGAGRKAEALGGTPPQPAQKDPADAYRRALEKCGGTPFYLRELRLTGDAAAYVPAGEANGLRRQALDRLLALRQAPAPPMATDYVYEAPAPAMPAAQGLLARFESVAQVPGGVWAARESLEGLFLPVGQWADVPEAWRGKTWLELPRAQFRPEDETALAALIEKSKSAGFAGYCAQNLSHFHLLRGAGAPIFGGFGLNVANPAAAGEYGRLGAKALTTSIELAAACLPAVAGAGLPLAALAYGHLPLMLTRACPLWNIHGCKGCPGAGELLDRKGMRLPVRCTAPGMAGARTVYNAVPLYMADRAREVPARWLLLYFTVEGPQRAARVLELARAGKPFDGPFTRGLYYR